MLAGDYIHVSPAQIHFLIVLSEGSSPSSTLSESVFELGTSSPAMMYAIIYHHKIHVGCVILRCSVWHISVFHDFIELKHNT